MAELVALLADEESAWDQVAVCERQGHWASAAAWRALGDHFGREALDILRQGVSHDRVV